MWRPVGGCRLVRCQLEHVGTLGVSGGHVGSLKVYVGSVGSSDGNSDLVPASVSPLLSVSAEIATFNGPKSSLAGVHCPPSQPELPL